MDGLIFKPEIYGKIYGVTRNVTYAEGLLAQHKLKDHVHGRVYFLEADLAKKDTIERVLEETKADSIFLVTTTNLPPDSISCKNGELSEYSAIRNFFDALVSVFEKDKLPRHVVFSAADNVESIMMQLSEHTPSSSEIIKPLSDGSIAANFSGKGRGAIPILLVLLSRFQMRRKMNGRSTHVWVMDRLTCLQFLTWRILCQQSLIIQNSMMTKT